MFVCAHGEISEFCKNYDVIVAEEYDGEIEEYAGVFPVLVTDAEMTEAEYFYLKGKMLAKGVELVSTRHSDMECMTEILAYHAKGQPKKGGRQKFGFVCDNGVMRLHEEGKEVVRRILELRDSGCAYREIREDAGVHHRDGRKLSVSTIQIIVKNREEYEKEGL